MRLVPNQDPNKIARLFEKHIKKIAPKSVKIKILNLHGGYPSITNIDNPANIAASKAMAKAFGKKTVFMREGGSIPIVTEFSKKLKAPVVLMGLGLNTENPHSPNEHFDLNHFELGIISSAYFMKEFAGTK
jgi:acetylornithine deacetylase/succinyl-diaminopimelate desuccinylase-like protein